MTILDELPLPRLPVEHSESSHTDPRRRNLPNPRNSRSNEPLAGHRPERSWRLPTQFHPALQCAQLICGEAQDPSLLPVSYIPRSILYPAKEAFPLRRTELPVQMGLR